MEYIYNFKPVRTKEITGSLKDYVGEKAVIVNNNNGAKNVFVDDIVELGRQSYSGFNCHKNSCNHINFKNLRVIVKESPETKIKYPTVPDDVRSEDMVTPFITLPAKPIVLKELSMKKENKIPKNFYRVFTNDGKTVNPRGVVEQDARAARGRRGSDTRPFVREIIKKETAKVSELIKELDIAAAKEDAKDKYDIELSYILDQLEIYQKYLKSVEASDNRFIIIGDHYNASINTSHFYRLQQLLKNPVKYDWVERELTYELVSKSAVTLFKSKKFIIDVVNGQIKLTKVKADLTMTVDIKHNSKTNKFYL